MYQDNNFDKIVYEKIARKDISFWLILDSEDTGELMITWSIEGSTPYSREPVTAYCKPLYGKDTPDYKIYLKDVNIVGHTILLSDVLHYIHTYVYKDRIAEKCEHVLIEWDYSKPDYEDQSDELKQYIFNLL